MKIFPFQKETTLMLINLITGLISEIAVRELGRSNNGALNKICFLSI